MDDIQSVEQILDSYHGFEPTTWKDGTQLWRSIPTINRTDALAALERREERIKLEAEKLGMESAMAPLIAIASNIEDEPGDYARKELANLHERRNEIKQQLKTLDGQEQ